jgi:hypothetical protein
VSGVVKCLRAFGYSVWWELGDIGVGEAFQEQYYTECLKAKWGVAFVSKNYSESPWTMQEWGVLAEHTERVHILLDPIPEIKTAINQAVRSGNKAGSKLGMELSNAGSVQFLLGDVPCRNPEIIAKHLDRLFAGKFVKNDACDDAYLWSQSGGGVGSPQ